MIPMLLIVPELPRAELPLVPGAPSPGVAPFDPPAPPVLAKPPGDIIRMTPASIWSVSPGPTVTSLDTVQVLLIEFHDPPIDGHVVEPFAGLISVVVEA